MGNQLTMIRLKEVQPPFANVASVQSLSPPPFISTGNLASATTATAKVTASPVQPKLIPQSKPIIQPVQVSYSWKKLTDNDIPHVIKEVLQQKLHKTQLSREQHHR